MDASTIRMLRKNCLILNGRKACHTIGRHRRSTNISPRSSCL